MNCLDNCLCFGPGSYTPIVQCRIRTNLTILPSYNVSAVPGASNGIQQFTVIGTPGVSSVSRVGPGTMSGWDIMLLSLIQLSITSIDDDAFADMENLFELILTGNSLQTISPRMFTGINRTLYKLDLSDNQIRTLGIDTFQNCLNLQQLFLAGNMLTEITQDVSMVQV
jgi:Leucine-rich repeat (LRR) protein